MDHGGQTGHQQRGARAAQGLGIEAWRRRLHMVTEVLQAASGRLDGLGAIRMHWHTAEILQHERDLQPPRWPGDQLPVRRGRRRGEVGRAHVRADHRVQQARAVAHGTGHRVLMAHAVRGVAAMRPGGDQPAGGLEADQAVDRGRNADRTAAVGGMGSGQDASRHGRRRTPTGPARAVGQVPGVARRAGQCWLRRHVHAELGRCGTAQDAQTGAAQASHRLAVEVGQVVDEQPAAMAQRHTLDRRVQVLDEIGHAGERPVGCGRRVGVTAAQALGEGLVQPGDRVDGRVHCPQARQRGLHHLLHGEVAAADGLGQTGRVVAPVIFER